ncbi:MAG: SUMF1/EgtB/PvdO family nonheme iron enzyme [Anaerolineales bacterium]|nr:SUMF1/EgtB/PvdO family nonheme iron enzyme [Anaerolineales bacterium]
MSDEMIGRDIGRYQILELIGEGGMATVYKALDTRLEREVAVKVIRREVFSAGEMEMLLKRFEREAKSLGRLSHPNIVPVIDYGEFEGAPYLVMVYLPGGTLKDRLGKPIPWREAVQMLMPIAHALEYVHDQNIINRDIKPSNILLTKNGEPMLTDFGLVKVYGDKGRDTTVITGTGAGLGTPDYMAPEQWIGETTAKSDMYSLGVVLYEMITGRRPYKADTPAGVLLKQASEPLPLPTNYIPDLPRDVESVMLKVLAKDPENRYADIHVFVSELERLLTGEKVTASSIKVEKLRAQMTGTVERQPIPTPAPSTPAVTPTPQPSYAPATPAIPPATRRKKNLVLPAILIALFGGAILVAAIGGCWFLYNNPDLFYIDFGPTSAPVVQQVAASPTIKPPLPTTISPTETEIAVAASATTAPPTEAALPEEIKDGKGVPMRLVPAGEFSMGSDDSVDVFSRPAHTVFLEAFYIDQFEVTNEMYARCNSPECRRPKQPGSITRSTYYNNQHFADYPVLYVDWWMARAYCDWRGARLPTEAEWEKAARGTDGRVYPWESQERSCFYSNLAGCEEDTTPVDQYEQGQSIYGVYDLSGNVWEWTSSLFQPYPYDPEDGRERLTAQGKRVLRGGSFHVFGVKSGTARSDTRFEMDPSYYGAYVGLRCVMNAETE